MSYFIFQGNDYDCGFASLKNLLANFAKDKSYLYIPKGNKKDNFTIADLVEIAETYGFQLEPYTCDEDYFNKIKTPSLAIINCNHVVMVKKVSKQSITYLDPEVGQVKVSKQKFLQNWQKIVVEIEPVKPPEKLPKLRREILPLKTRIFSSLISLICIGILIGSFYLLNNQSNAWFSFIFLGVFAATLIVEKVLLSKEVYQFDKKFIPLYFEEKKNRDKICYVDFMSFKQKYFVENRELLSSIILAFTITFLLCLNDFRNVFVLLALILLKTLEKILFSKSEDNLKRKIIESENKCCLDKNNFSGHALRANCLANEQILISAIKNVFFMVVSFAFALLMMFITGNSGCNYVIFHFGLYYFGSNSLSSIIDSLSNRKEMKKMECRFFDECNL